MARIGIEYTLERSGSRFPEMRALDVKLPPGVRMASIETWARTAVERALEDEGIRDVTALTIFNIVVNPIDTYVEDERAAKRDVEVVFMSTNATSNALTIPTHF